MQREQHITEARQTLLIGQTIGLGLIAGARSMLAPALLTRALRAEQSSDGDLAHWWQQAPRFAPLLIVFALGELVGDKLPFTPNRISPPALIGRLCSGFGVGALLWASRSRPPLLGALLGGAAAVGGTYATYYLRQWCDQATGLPDPVIGAVEDGLMIVAGIVVLRLSNLGE